MLAIQVSQVGGPEVLTLVDLPIPAPKPDEAIVQIKAAGVNFIDVYFREGRYPAPLPFINGQEAAGIVTSIGEEVSEVKPGDRVAYTGVRGSYAEYAAVPADRLVAIPDQVDFESAAAAMLQGMTAHYLSHSTYPIQRGDTMLIHAAAGGVGLLLVQMAKQLGARVIGTAGNSDKARLAREAGADEVIIYSEQDFETETKRLTNNEGVHVVYDGVGKIDFRQRSRNPETARLPRPFWRRKWASAAIRSDSTIAERFALSNSPESASLHSHARGTRTARW